MEDQITHSFWHELAQRVFAVLGLRKRKHQTYLCSTLLYLMVQCWNLFTTPCNNKLTYGGMLLALCVLDIFALQDIAVSKAAQRFQRRLFLCVGYDESNSYQTLLLLPGMMGIPQLPVLRFGMYALGYMLDFCPHLSLCIAVESLYFLTTVTEPQSQLLCVCFVFLISVLSKYRQDEEQGHKNEAAQNIQMMKEKTENLSIKNRFIATLTHEMRNFVTKYSAYVHQARSIVTNSTLLKEAKRWDEEIVSELVQASSVLLEILSNTLDISKLEEGKVQFNKNYDAITDVIDMVINITKANANSKQIKVVPSYGAKLPPLIEFDKSRLVQIIMNLAGNAIKFTPEKGRVSIKVDWMPRKPTRKKTTGTDIGLKRPATSPDTSSQELSTLQKLVPGSEREELKVPRRGGTNLNMKLERAPDSNVLASGPLEDVGFLEKVPDEVSPLNNSPNRKIPSKICSYKFTTNFHKRPRHRELKELRASWTSGVRAARARPRPQLPELEAEQIRQRSGSPESFTESAASPQLVISDSNNSRDGDYTCVPRNCRTDFPTQVAISAQKPRTDTDRSYHRSRSLHPWNVDEGVMKLKNVAKEFRLSFRELPISSSPIRFARLSARGRLTRSPRRHKMRLMRGSTLPALVEISPKTNLLQRSELTRKGLLTIEVTDTGCGMSEEELQGLFQPFVQANKDVHSKFGGTGLGLWLSHKLITAMGGHIACSSELGKGSTFTVSLEANYKLRPDDSSANASSIFRGFAVLCLLKHKDEVQMPLRNTGCNVIVCKDSAQLLEQLLKHKKQQVTKQTVIVGAKSAKEILEANRSESLGLRPSQIIVITRIASPDVTLLLGKLVTESVEQQPYQYVLARPVNQYYLLEVLMHVIRGQELLKQQQTATIPRSPELFTERPSVLIADDNELCKSAVRRLVQKHTSRILLSEDGLKALILFKNSYPNIDLAIVDCNMPKIDGITLISAIRDFESMNGADKKRVTIVFMSGEEGQDVEEEAKKAGADYTLKKPVTATILDEIMKKVNSKGNKAKKPWPRSPAITPSQFCRQTEHKQRQCKICRMDEERTDKRERGRRDYKICRRCPEQQQSRLYNEGSLNPNSERHDYKQFRCLRMQQFFTMKELAISLAFILILTMPMQVVAVCSSCPKGFSCNSDDACSGQVACNTGWYNTGGTSLSCSVCQAGIASSLKTQGTSVL